MSEISVPSLSPPSCLEAEIQAWIGFETIKRGPLTFTDDPFETIISYTLADVLPCLVRIEQLTNQGYHAVGQIAYEAASVFEPAMRVPARSNFTDFPLLWFAIYDSQHVHVPKEKTEQQNSTLYRTLQYHPGNHLVHRNDTITHNSSDAVPCSHLSSSSDGKISNIKDKNKEETVFNKPTLKDTEFSSLSSFPSVNNPVTTGSLDTTTGIGNSGWKPDMNHEEYDNSIKYIRENIRKGVCYQVNHTIRLRHEQWLFSSLVSSSDSIVSSPTESVSASERKNNLLQFHARLLAAQQCGYGAYIDMGRYHILSASPELFFHWERRTTNDNFENNEAYHSVDTLTSIQGTNIRTRPMKGTRTRGKSTIEDEIARQELLSSLKERAENLMIVDLLRNDLGRIALKGTVKVTNMFKIEQYPTVLQMTSTVTAKLPLSTRLTDVLRALFPCGSVTGAPKISAMNIISDIETSARNTYCGTIMYIEPGFNGAITASVPIRTVIVDTQTGIAQYGVGGGITWDSTAHGEYEEVLAKAQVLISASSSPLKQGSTGLPNSKVSNAGTVPWWTSPNFSLLETMRMKSDGTIILWDNHKQRLQASARYFQYFYDEKLLNRTVDNFRKTMISNALSYPKEYRIRLTMDSNGVPDITATELPSLSSPGLMVGVQEPLRTILSSQSIQSRDVFLYHKTTNRTVYDNFRNRYCSNPVDHIVDVLLMNEKEEITEFCIGNVVLEVPIDATDKKNGKESSLESFRTKCTVETGYDNEEFEKWPVPEKGYRFITPSLSCGLLPGVLRSYLLESRYMDIEETIIPSRIIIQKLYRRIWLINSVRGWVSVTVSMDADV